MSKKTYTDYGYSFNSDSGNFVLSRDNLRKLDPVVFERAAERIDNKLNTHTCLAISAVTGNDYDEPHRDAWYAAFGPTHYPYAAHPFWNKSSTPQTRQNRMTSLAMMATLARDARASRGVKRKKVSQ